MNNRKTLGKKQKELSQKGNLQLEVQVKEAGGEVGRGEDVIGGLAGKVLSVGTCKASEQVFK